MYTYIHTYIHACMHTYKHVHLWINEVSAQRRPATFLCYLIPDMHECMCLFVAACMCFHARMFICVYVC